MLKKIAVILLIIGGLNWGLIGVFSFNLVSWLCGGYLTIFSRIIYTLVGLAGIVVIIEALTNKERD